MAPVNASTVAELLSQGPFRTMPNHKQLTIALGGTYIASTTQTCKPTLVWETEKSYARYYIPVESLLKEIQARLKDSQQTGSGSHIEVAAEETVSGNGNSSKAVIERLSVGSKTTTWVRFLEGPLKNFIRFERDEMGETLQNHDN